MRVCLCVVLFLTITTVLSAEDKVTVRLGDGSTPVVDARSFGDIPLTGGHARLQVVTTQPRAIQFVIRNGRNASITCSFAADQQSSNVPIALGAWYRIRQATDCSITAPENLGLQLGVLNVPTSIIDQLKPADAANVWQVAGVDSTFPVITMDLSFRQFQGKASLVKFLLLGLLVLALAFALTAVMFKWIPFSWFKKERFNKKTFKKETFNRKMADGNMSETKTFGKENLLRTGVKRIWTYLQKSERPVKPVELPQQAGPAVSELPRQSAEEIDDLQRRLIELTAKQGELDSHIQGLVSQNNLSQAVTDIRRELVELHGLVAVMESVENKTLIEIRGELAGLERSLKEQQRTIQQLQSSRSNDLQALLKRGLQEHFESGPGRPIMQQMDNAVSRYVSESLPGQELLPCRERARMLGAAIARLLEGVTPSSPELEEKLKPLVNQSRQMEGEITDLLPQDGNSRLKLTVEFETSQSGSGYLMQGMATGLARQIAKLENPVEHFDYQLQVLAANAAQTAVDFLDSNIDRQRSNVQLQSLLNDLLCAGDLEQISPAPKDGFRALEHRMVDMLPRPVGVSDGPTVARLLARGFRRGKDVLRPASVILYE